jgi:UDP-N-acetylglucosamine 3-dehydrogenase
VASVYALTGSGVTSQFEDHANILLNFKNDIHAFIEVNWLTPMKVRKVSLTCSSSFVELDYLAQSLQVSSSTFMELDISDLYSVPQRYDIRKIDLKPEEPLRRELQDFLNAIIQKRKPLVTGADGLEAIVIAHAAQESSRLGKVITLEQ